jgi:hypothetical protein
MALARCASSTWDADWDSSCEPWRRRRPWALVSSLSAWTSTQDGARCVIISSGLVHHLPEPGLPEFFAAQARLRVAAFAHWDIAPCLWSTFGAWVYHYARMREPVSRHDGVLSARRAYSAARLQMAAQTGAPGYGIQVMEGSHWHPRALDVLRPVMGTLL